MRMSQTRSESIDLTTIITPRHGSLLSLLLPAVMPCTSARALHVKMCSEFTALGHVQWKKVDFFFWSLFVPLSPLSRWVSILVLGPISKSWNKNWNKFELWLHNFIPIFIPTFGGPKWVGINLLYWNCLYQFPNLRPRLNYSLKRFVQIFSTRGFEFIGDNF